MAKQTFTHTDDKGLTEVEYDVQVHEVESVKGSKSPVSGVYLAEAKKIRGRSTRSNVSKNPFSLLKKSSYKKISDSEWLKLAEAGEDDNRETIAKAHKNWAADGFRLHLIENKKECDCKYCKNRESGDYPMSPDYRCLIPRNFNGEVVMNRDDILIACDQNKAINPSSGAMRWLVKSNLVEISVKNVDTEDNGSSEFTDIQQTGREIIFALNVNFVKDSVKYMAEKVTIKYQAHNAPFLFTDGNRTALLMPIHIG